VRHDESSTLDIVVDEETIKSKFIVPMLHERLNSSLQTNSHGAELELRQHRPLLRTNLGAYQMREQFTTLFIS